MNYINSLMISVHDHPGKLHYCEPCESVMSIKNGFFYSHFKEA